MGRSKGPLGVHIVTCDCGKEDCAEKYVSYSNYFAIRGQVKHLGGRVRQENGTNHWLLSGHVADWEWVTDACMCKGVDEKGNARCTITHRSYLKPMKRREEMFKAKWRKAAPDQTKAKKVWLAPGHDFPAAEKVAEAA
jgi:hypothetical protein